MGGSDLNDLIVAKRRFCIEFLFIQPGLILVEVEHSVSVLVGAWVYEEAFSHRDAECSLDSPNGRVVAELVQ